MRLLAREMYRVRQSDGPSRSASRHGTEYSLPWLRVCPTQSAEPRSLCTEAVEAMAEFVGVSGHRLGRHGLCKRDKVVDEEIALTSSGCIVGKPILWGTANLEVSTLVKRLSFTGHSGDPDGGGDCTLSPHTQGRGGYW